MRLAFVLFLPFIVNAQFIPAGSPIPKGPNPPVVFLNGYQSGCSGGPVSFSGTFGIADQILQSANIYSTFFDNCTVPNSPEPTIEALGIAFGKFLAGLKFADGTAVTQVDVVAHSMGGLIVRSYLAGKQDVSSGPAVFSPPATVPIRKAIFLATPHNGTAIASLLGSDVQTHEMALGSQFLFDLSTWNDNNDDLRGVDALALAGNGGTGGESQMPGFDDGVVTLTSASIGFARPGRTRVVPFCHTNDTLLVLVNFCSASTPGIAAITNASDIVGQMMVSFLTGTTLWQNLGQAIEANSFGSKLSGIMVEAGDLNGVEQTPMSAAASAGGAAGTSIKLGTNAVAYSEAISSQINQVQVQTVGGASVTQAVALRAGSGNSVFAKPGPAVSGAVTAGSAIFPYNVAPGGYVAVYGWNLTTMTTPLSSAVPYPNQLGDVQVLVNGTPAQVQFVSQGQLNFVFPNASPGPAQVTVKSGGGQQTLTVLVAASVPSIFTLDGTENGPAAARVGNIASDPVVTSLVPLHFGDTVELYMTGLGTASAPMVTIGGQNCTVTFSGLVPGYTGFDQVNCQVPSGVAGAAVPVIVTANGWASNAATLNVQ
jgi:uncharacterized protein (TIGR03437 family)